MTALINTNNLSDVSDVGTSRYNLNIAILGACQVVATENLTPLSGTPTIDGYATASHDQVLCVGQKTASENGPWVVASGAWKRPDDYPHGGQIKGRSVPITTGAMHGGVWVLQALSGGVVTGGMVTVDTTDTAWQRLLRDDASGLNLADYLPNDFTSGSTDVTNEVTTWLSAVASTRRRGYVPAGTYMVQSDMVFANLQGVVITGDGDRVSTFCASTSGIRVLDFRNSASSTFKDFAVSGNSVAQVGLDLGTSVAGTSSGNHLYRVRGELCTVKQHDLTNNGDTVHEMCTLGPIPHTSPNATGLYWPNSGGNGMIQNPKFITYTDDSSPATPGSASVQASFQNMSISDGGMVGLKILDSQTSQTLRVSGTQFFPIAGGGNLIGPTSGSGVYAVEIGGAAKFAVNDPTQCYFDGQFQFAIIARACTFNSGVPSGATGGPNGNGTANAFGLNFAGSHSDVKLLLQMIGCVLESNAGCTPAVWNDQKSTNVERDYRKFYNFVPGSPTIADLTDIVRAGDGVTAGQGLQVGNGTVMRQWDSLTASWSPPAVANGSFAATSVTYSGMVPGQWAGVAVTPTSGTLPDGVIFAALCTTANIVRVTLLNNAGASYSAPALNLRLYRMNV